MITDTKKANTYISVILPVFNGGVYLAMSIQSVLQQSMQHFELLILDDCSTDASWSYISSIKDARVSKFRNDINKGLFFNLNFLIKESKSELIKLWSQDDIMYSNCLETTVEFHKKHPAVGFSYSGRDIIDETGEIKKSTETDTTPEIISPHLHTSIAFFTGSIAGNIANVCLNREALNKVGLFREDMKISADFDMWVRIAKEHNIGFIRSNLIQLRDHDKQLSRNPGLLIYHVREDLEIFRNLLERCDKKTKREGRQMLRRRKMVFYYTLMLKSLLGGQVKNTLAYFKELRSFDNFFLLTFFFFKAKISRPIKPNFK
jgi:glycosyltransferase involved in cell wall biosynthesis